MESPPRGNLAGDIKTGGIRELVARDTLVKETAISGDIVVLACDSIDGKRLDPQLSRLSAMRIAINKCARAFPYGYGTGVVDTGKIVVLGESCLAPLVLGLNRRNN